MSPRGWCRRWGCRRLLAERRGRRALLDLIAAARREAEAEDRAGKDGHAGGKDGQLSEGAGEDGHAERD